MKTLISLFKNEDGATAIEYGLIAALLSVVIIVVLGNVGDSLEATYQDVDDALQSAQ
jgi:pilus assembly protein Flp/PilA